MTETPEITSPKKVNPNRVRDHLANERTYLSWMRTAIALMGFGMVILRLRAFHPPMTPRPGYGWKLGLMFSLVGLLTVFLTTGHYFSVRRDIDEDTYEPADRWVILFSLAIVILGAGIIYFVAISPDLLIGNMMTFE
ncbi:YidH family protein [Pannus brasiliensis]|uniref:YidH family protein n=1 Tax=Pannus brasiliensis TaxID=1579216 RepID=UPI003BEEE24B